MAPRKLHLNVNLLHSGVHASAWRQPESDPGAGFDPGHDINVTKIAECGKFYAIKVISFAIFHDHINHAIARAG